VALSVPPIRVLFLGVAISAAGVIVAATVHKTAGGVVLVVGWLLAIVGIHAFGRSAITD
jgi:hypothetical protein